MGKLELSPGRRLIWAERAGSGPLIPQASVSLPVTSCPFSVERLAELDSGLPAGQRSSREWADWAERQAGAKPEGAPCLVGVAGSPTLSCFPTQPRLESGTPGPALGLGTAGKRK